MWIPRPVVIAVAPLSLNGALVSSASSHQVFDPWMITRSIQTSRGLVQGGGQSESCPTSHVCVEASGILGVTHDDGRSWTSVEMPMGGSATAVACSSASVCVAVDANNDDSARATTFSPNTSGARSWEDRSTGASESHWSPSPSPSPSPSRVRRHVGVSQWDPDQVPTP